MPYTLDSNDMRFATAQGFNSGDQFFAYLKDSFDTLYAEGAVAPKMLSIGLHCRLVGRPGRAASLARFLDYVAGHDKVWIATRLDIARHWIAKHPPAGGWKPSKLSRTLFVERFGGVYEHSRWVAEAAYDAGSARAPTTPKGLARAMARAMAGGSEAAKRALIVAHPDLAGKLALAKSLTAESTHEQQSAGLDRLSAEELARFTALNAAYRARFGFPFIMAVKGKTKQEILAAFERRLGHDAQANSPPRSPRSIASPRCGSRRSCRDGKRAHRSRPNLELSRRPAGWRASARFPLIEDGAVRIENGEIAAVGEARAILAQRAAGRRDRRPPGKLVMPGFIDTHIHYPQTRVIGSYGAQLLDWLQKYTFVEEQKFADPAPLRGGRALLPRRIVPPGHDDGLRLLHRPSRIGRRVLQREREARRAHDRGQGDDGPQRARRADATRRSAATTKARR